MCRVGMDFRHASAPRAVIPAKAGIHLALMPKVKMDSRFRGNDGKGDWLAKVGVHGGRYIRAQRIPAFAGMTARGMGSQKWESMVAVTSGPNGFPPSRE